MTCILLLIAVTAVLTSGCERAGPLEADDDLEPTLRSIQVHIFNSSCALSGCHGAASPQQGMDLSEGQSFGDIVNVSSQERPELLRVDPGDPDQSYLVMKVEGAAGIVGARMPLGRPPLSDEQITVLRQWIADGAPDN